MQFDPSLVPWIAPAPTPYDSPLEHLEDHLGRMSDLVAAALARAPERQGRRIDRRELIDRAALRGADDVPPETHALWQLADQKLAHLRAREALSVQLGVELPLLELVRAFGLSDAERDALVLAAAPHVDPRYAAEWDHVGDLSVARPSVQTALMVLGRTFEDSVALRAMFSTRAPLIDGSLLMLGGRSNMSEGDFLSLELEVPRRIIGALLGDQSIDEELVAFSCVRAPLATMEQVVLPTETKALVTSIVEHHGDWLARRRAWGVDEVIAYGRGLVLLFAGPPGTGKTMLAHAIAHGLGKKLFVVDAAKLGDGQRTLESNLDAVFRETRMLDAVLFFDEAEQIFASRRVGNDAMATLLTRLERFEGIAVLATNMEEVLDEALHRRIIATVRFQPPAAGARAQIWSRHLPQAMPLDATVDVDRLATEFELTGGLIKNAVLTAVLHAAARDADAVSMDDLVHGARLQVRVTDDGSGTLVRPEVQLDDVVLDREVRERLDRFISGARARATVLAEWGFGRTLGRGTSLAVLLAGPSGTGKSMTAEAIARALDRPLLRANVAGLLSKYIGDTAKRMDLMFERAREHRAVLLFDEADALFARRVSIHTANDRFANAETAALLAALERHEGVVVLTTNLEAELDPAFARRFQMRIGYSRPDVAARTAIWQKLVPAEAPLSPDVDLGRLARAFDLSGGQIRNAVLAAALEAAGAAAGQRRITQESLQRSARAQLGEAQVEAVAPRAAGLA